MLDKALYYSKIFHWKVFPCKNKIPATPHGFKDASSDPEQIKKYFTCKGFNIGIATGEASGFFVLDVDVKNNAGGRDSLIELESQFGELPRTVFSVTQSGGNHFYFLSNPKVKCKTGFRKGLDIKSDGGYIIAPPSKTNNGEYKWINSPDDTPIAEAPEWLFNFITAETKKPKTEPQNAQIASGGRHDYLVRQIAIPLRKMLGLEAHDIYETLKLENSRVCAPPVPDAELRSIAQSVMPYETSKIIEKRYSDFGLCDTFCDQHAKQVKHCDQKEGWMFYGDIQWSQDDNMIVHRMARSSIENLQHISILTNNDKLFKFSTKVQKHEYIEKILKLVKIKKGN